MGAACCCCVAVAVLLCCCVAQGLARRRVGVAAARPARAARSRTSPGPRAANSARGGRFPPPLPRGVAGGACRARKGPTSARWGAPACAGTAGPRPRPATRWCPASGRGRADAKGFFCSTHGPTLTMNVESWAQSGGLGRCVCGPTRWRGSRLHLLLLRLGNTPCKLLPFTQCPFDKLASFYLSRFGQRTKRIRRLRAISSTNHARQPVVARHHCKSHGTTASAEGMAARGLHWFAKPRE